MVVLCNEESIPLIVTVVPARVLPVVLTPDPLTTTPPASAIDTIVPALLPGSGWVLGKDTSLLIGTKLPLSRFSAATISLTAFAVGN